MAKNNKKPEIEELKGEIDRLKKELKKRKKYGLLWEEKSEDMVDLCKKKLPVVKEVKSKDITTDKDRPVNLLIEGDNYHALSVLNYTHAKKVDVIYIDPPYNTGNKDFIFNDNYIDKEDAYRHSKCRWKDVLKKEGISWQRFQKILSRVPLKQWLQNQRTWDDIVRGIRDGVEKRTLRNNRII